MAIDPAMMVNLRNQHAAEGRPLADKAFLYQSVSGEIWLDHGVLGTAPEKIQDAPAPSPLPAPSPPAVPVP